MLTLLIMVVKIVAIAVVFLMTIGALLTLVERKQSAIIQNRVGPNRANLGPLRLWGLLHPVADGIKAIWKEDIVPHDAKSRLHFIAPFLALFTAMAVAAVIPFMDTWCSDTVIVDFGLAATHHGVEYCAVDSQHHYFQIANIDAGLLYVFAISGLGVYGAVLAGWSSNNKFSLFGGLRTSAQMISYEVSMLLSLAGIIMIFGTIDLNDMVREQGELLWGWLPKWGIVVQPVAFFLFLAAAIAETKRAPFDLPEAESELVAGYHTEYSGMKFATFFLSEFVGIVIVGMLVTVLFLGGWQVPFLYADGFHVGGSVVELPYLLVVGLRLIAFVVKVLFMCWFQLLIRWTVPRFRYDQVMMFGWKILLPLALANLLVTGIVMLAI